MLLNATLCKIFIYDEHFVTIYAEIVEMCENETKTIRGFISSICNGWYFRFVGG